KSADVDFLGPNMGVTTREQSSLAVVESPRDVNRIAQTRMSQSTSLAPAAFDARAIPNWALARQTSLMLRGPDGGPIWSRVYVDRLGFRVTFEASRPSCPSCPVIIRLPMRYDW